MATEIDLDLVHKANKALRAGNFHAALTYLQRFLQDRPEISDEQRVTNARDTMRRTYLDAVDGATKDVLDDYCDGTYDGDRDEMISAIESIADGHVTYTSTAQECLLFSTNDGAGPDELGADGFDWKSGIPWSQLAFFAFRADVLEALEQLGVDMNADPPAAGETAVKCDQCGNVKSATKGASTCNECEEAAGNEACDTCHTWYAPEFLKDGVCEKCAPRE
jgi:hypothetical protein